MQIVLTCHRCGVPTQHNLVGNAVQYEGLYREFKFQKKDGVYTSKCKYQHHIYKCVLCQEDVYRLVRPRQLISILRKDDALEGINFPEGVVFQWPVRSKAAEPGVPEDVAKAGSDAEKSFSVGVYNGVATMGRLAMECLCDDKGAKGRDLYTKLDDLKNKHIITPDIHSWATELRVLGKCGAHSEWEDVSAEEAKAVISFMGEVLNYVYVVPYKFNQAKGAQIKPKK